MMKTSLFPLINNNPRYPAPFITSGLFKYLSTAVSVSLIHHRKRYGSPIYSRVFEIGWEIFNEEVSVKPPSRTPSVSADEIYHYGNNTEDSKDFQTLGCSPNVKADESLA